MSHDVTLLGTGGTIASTDAESGATPTKRGEELVEAVPELGEYGEITVRDVANRPSFDMDFETMSAIASEARAAAEDGADGVVVTHGTDTMEESAYFLDLTLDIETPVVFTGAQRRPDEVSADGPANLLTAVGAVCDEDFAGAGGVYIAANETVHAARHVTKTHTSKLETFDSPERGPVAMETRDGFRLFREPGSESRTMPVDGTDARVAIVSSAAGVGRRPIDAALDAGVDGIVVGGTGLGNTTSEIGLAIGDAVDGGTPVVVTSRCHGGSTAAVYGTDGGGETLRTRGAIQGGDLPAHKARIKLALAIEASDDVDEIREWFEGGT